ncbi:unnamed protein product [Symbiodinium necroappetens]|uniref:Uncharacterized protein n=1 Tax=Symbiodinium necroappetens TaxID=1628268 RepID=A0A812NR01_9DINO|nr:unnamed protein product [Symbiodinium necroappetens]CAE7944399.1 unnamed protein product [Symbiodinium sp. KB8]
MCSVVLRFARCFPAQPDAFQHPSDNRKRLEGRAAEGELRDVFGLGHDHYPPRAVPVEGLARVAAANFAADCGVTSRRRTVRAAARRRAPSGAFLQVESGGVQPCPADHLALVLATQAAWHPFP